MRYYGGKHYLKKEILPIILKDRKPDQLYWEPFIGGANTFQDVANPRLGSDFNPYLIALLTAVRDGWIPPTELTEEQYLDIKNNHQKYPPELVGFAGQCTFAAVWFSTFSRGASNRKNVVRETSNSLKRSGLKLKDSVLICGHYSEVGNTLPQDSLIYCDPPYKSAPYGYYGPKFDSDSFWQWAEEMSVDHTVFVSEYEAPQGWESIWEKSVEINTRGKLKKEDRSIKIENLFVYRGK